jgi:hypothetical protein
MAAHDAHRLPRFAQRSPDYRSLRGSTVALTESPELPPRSPEPSRSHFPEPQVAGASECSERGWKLNDGAGEERAEIEQRS